MGNHCWILNTFKSRPLRENLYFFSASSVWLLIEMYTNTAFIFKHVCEISWRIMQINRTIFTVFERKAENGRSSRSVCGGKTPISTQRANLSPSGNRNKKTSIPNKRFDFSESDPSIWRKTGRISFEDLRFLCSAQPCESFSPFDGFSLLCLFFITVQTIPFALNDVNYVKLRLYGF